MDRIGKRGFILGKNWGNHDVEFDECLSEFSYFCKLRSEKSYYFNGIGKLKVNNVEYKIGLAHHYMGLSIYNPNHEHIRFLKEHYW